MHLCCFKKNGGEVPAIHFENRIYPISELFRVLERSDQMVGYSTTEQILSIARDPSLMASLLGAVPRSKGLGERDIEYGVPIRGPVIGVGRNYQDHVGEGKLTLGDYPKLFFKHVNSLTAHNQKVTIPPTIQKTDWEAELGVVIGKRMFQVKEEDAIDYVAGFLNINDVSAREYQFDLGPAQTSFAKSMDGFCPCGPWLVTADEVPDCQNLRVRCELNGEVVQDANTSNMIYSVAYILSYISQFMTLEPGYMVSTGTPQGIGHFRDPPRYLDDGDVIEVSVDRLGSLRNQFIRV